MNKLNNKGFTLVELLATVVLLGVISAIAMVSIDGMLDHANISECENILLSIKSATKEFISTNRFNLKGNSKLKTDSSGNMKFELTVKDLIVDSNTTDKITAGGYLSSSINNPFDKKTLVDTQLENLKIYVTLYNDYTYQSAEIKNSSGLFITCSEDVKTGSVRFPG